MRILPDTSAYAGFKRNFEAVVHAFVSADEILFSPVVLGELLFGFRCGSRFSENMDDLERFLAHPAVHLVPIGKTTADRFSRIAAELRAKGTPIPSNDIWIAAQAMEHGAELVSCDYHFEHVSGLVHTHFNQP